MKARFDGANTVVIWWPKHRADRHIDMPVVSPSRVDRSTGTLRSPEAAVDLPPDVVADALTSVAVPADHVPADQGSVIGLLVHVVSRRATAVGIFSDSGQAIEWWAQPFNRLAHDPDVLFCLIPVEDGS